MPRTRATAPDQHETGAPRKVTTYQPADRETWYFHPHRREIPTPSHQIRRGGFKSEQDAQRAGRKVARQIDDGTFVVRNAETVAGYLTGHLDQLIMWIDPAAATRSPSAEWRPSRSPEAPSLAIDGRGPPGIDRRSRTPRDGSVLRASRRGRRSRHCRDTLATGGNACRSDTGPAWSTGSSAMPPRWITGHSVEMI